MNPLIQPFAGLYVLIMAIMGPIVAGRSEQIGAVVLRRPKKRAVPAPRPDPMLAEEIALVESTGADPDAPSSASEQSAVDRLVEQAMNDPEPPARKREPDY
ncbi:hypothetical protein [Plantibacter sp. RU18]|uniref:hypothetical protein n=1 Tax=Plantibacter sp. RU18 TaxID=3158143 RepID=UPI003D35CD9C